MLTQTVQPPPAGPAIRCYDDAILRLPFFTGAHAALADRVTAWSAEYGFLCREPGPAVERVVLERLGKAGLLDFLNPGSDTVGGDVRSLCIAREGLAYEDDLADFAFSIQALGATPILDLGTPGQRERYLPGMAAGTVQGAFAISELAAGSDVAAIAATATRSGDGYVLNGTKAWIANAGTADVYCVIARTGEGPGPLGLSAFLVPGDTPGLSAEPVPLIAPRTFGHVHLDGCQLPADALLGRPGRGYLVGMRLLEKFRVTVGAAALGFARRAADTALAYAQERRIYDDRLLNLATVQAALADIQVQLNASALLVARAAWEFDCGDRLFANHSSIAKLYATEAAQQVIDASLQILGASGLVAGSVTERLYRQVRSLRIYEGTSEVQRAVIAQHLGRRRAGQ